MPDGISRSGLNSLSNPALASYQPEAACHDDEPSSTASTVTSARGPTATSYLPADHPASGLEIHKFRATGQVSWECMSDCASSQGLTGLGLTGAEAAAVSLASNIAGAAAMLTVATVTPIACYVACSDLEGLPPLSNQPEPVELPDASLYVP
jgi:hypothetical protein